MWKPGLSCSRLISRQPAFKDVRAKIFLRFAFAFSRSEACGLRFRGLCFRDSQQKFATLVYRAGTKHGPSLELKDKSIDKDVRGAIGVFKNYFEEAFAMAQTQKRAVYRAGTEQGPSFSFEHKIDEVWLVTDPKLYFPLNQGILRSIRRQRGESLKNVYLWKTDSTNLRKHLMLKEKFYGVCQVELRDSRNARCAYNIENILEIRTYLEALEWQKTTVPQCKGGLSLMDLSPMVQAMIVYMRDHYPTNPEELNFHAELKAASQWGWSNDYNQLVMKKVPLNDCRLKIAATETLKTWKKEKADLQTRKTEDSYSSHENVDEQLSDIAEAIGVLEKYIGIKASVVSHVNELVPSEQSRKSKARDLEQMETETPYLT
ncbi:uncharacterized protein [Acropora muricata]|uniref:uncharacterized protein n=1 Tax=Acropora muricata TaxID=159855 RepID=UPI0034E4DF3E